jgi:nifR3 family TIM-barrel protein
MENFWTKLKKPALPDGSRGRPIFCLAPMADVTDCAFRQIIAKYGKPDIFFTEFVSADGLCSPGKDKLLVDFIYGENERPIVAQIFGGKPENIKKAAELVKELGFDGIDINMGCPDKSIEKQCAGAGMMKDTELAVAVIRAAQEGSGGLPVSVKTRIGYNKNEIETWISALLKEHLAALTVHLRTRKEMSNVPAHWELMNRIVEIRDELSPETLILGNGDVVDIDDGRRKCEETGCDGVMLGRAIFGNPFLFTNKNVLSEVEGRKPLDSARGEMYVPSISDKLKVMIEHTKLFEEVLGKHKNFAIMKKHYKAYVNGFDGAKELRIKLMEAENAAEVESIVSNFLKNI